MWRFIYYVEQLGITLLSITGFLCLCSNCRNRIPVLFSFKAYHRVCNQSITTGVVNGVRTAYPSGSSEITTRLLVRFMLHDLLFFCVVFCKSLLVLFRLAVLFVVIDFSFGVFDEGSWGIWQRQTCWLFYAKFIWPINNTLQRSAFT